MAEIRKFVRFFDTVVIEPDETRNPAQGSFWFDLIDGMHSWSHQQREFPVSGVKYFGEPQHPVSPALPHIQVGRVRDLSEQLKKYNLTSGSVDPLTFEDPDDRVSEPTYIVPFGNDGRVAIMSPAVRATRHETLARWVTGVCELAIQGRSIELIPVVDEEVLAKIANAEGAVMLEVHVDAGMPIPDSGGGDLGDAFRAARHQATDELDLVLRWSLGRRNGTHSIRDSIREAALWVAHSGFSTKAEVNIVTENEEGSISRELHSIFDDRIAKRVEFFVPEGQVAPDEVVLASIGEAINNFLRGSSVGG